MNIDFDLNFNSEKIKTISQKGGKNWYGCVKPDLTVELLKLDEGTSISSVTRVMEKEDNPDNEDTLNTKEQETAFR